MAECDFNNLELDPRSFAPTANALIAQVFYFIFIETSFNPRELRSVIFVCRDVPSLHDISTSRPTSIENSSTVCYAMMQVKNAASFTEKVKICQK